jgi:hypothetical protein
MVAISKHGRRKYRKLRWCIGCTWGVWSAGIRFEKYHKQGILHKTGDVPEGLTQIK